MRLLIVCLLGSFFMNGGLHAGTIDIAVVQFPEEKGAAELEEALRRVSLFEITGADRTRMTEQYLRGSHQHRSSQAMLSNWIVEWPMP